MIGKTTVHGHGVAPIPRPPGIVYGTRRRFKRTTSVHIRNLRAKIESDPKNSCCILTVFGIGYKPVQAADAAWPYSQAVGAFALAIQALTVAVTLLANRLKADQYHAPDGSGSGTRIIVMF